MPDTISIDTTCPVPTPVMSFGLTLFAATQHAPVVSVPRDQLYYWSHQWQTDEEIAVGELARGEGIEFSSGREITNWLLSADED